MFVCAHIFTINVIGNMYLRPGLVLCTPCLTKYLFEERNEAYSSGLTGIFFHLIRLTSHSES